MPVRTANAMWKGNLKNGKGAMRAESGSIGEQSFSFSSRFESGRGTNPEELIGAALAGCFSMALAHEMAKEGFDPEEIDTTAKVIIEAVGGEYRISTIDLYAKVEVPEIPMDLFQKIANHTKENCPVARALGGVDILLSTELVQTAK